MKKNFFGPIAALLLVAMPLASAKTIDIDLGGFAYGTTIQEYYNGGRDSLNRMGGHDYGISFSSGSIKYTPGGAYLSGGVSMSLDVDKIRSVLGTDQYYVSFNAGRYDIDGGNARITYEDGSRDFFWITASGNPYCGVRWECFDGYLGMQGGYVTYNGPNNNNAQVSSISFASDRVSHIQIHSLAGSQLRVQPPTIWASQLTRDIPEPASVALFSVGAAALLARRRRKSTMI
jgi:hypothetical protein